LVTDRYHCTRALSFWNMRNRQASWIMPRRTRALPALASARETAARAPPADQPGSRRRRRAAAADRGRRFLFCNSGSGRTVELGRSGRTIMRARTDRSAPARRIPAGRRRPAPPELQTAPPELRRRRGQQPDRQIRRTGPEKAADALGGPGALLLQNQSTKMSGGCCGPLARSSFGLIFSSEKKAADWVGRFFVEPML
jgi:hypothetical protein